jgi:hypothetical protein
MAVAVRGKLCHGALQMVAAKLLDQLTQENKAESDVSDAVDAYNAAKREFKALSREEVGDLKGAE